MGLAFIIYALKGKLTLNLIDHGQCFAHVAKSVDTYVGLDVAQSTGTQLVSNACIYVYVTVESCTVDGYQ